MHDVALLDDVIGAFETHLAGVLAAGLAATGNEVFVGDGLCAKEALLEIGTHGSGGLRNGRGGRWPHGHGGCKGSASRSAAAAPASRGGAPPEFRRRAPGGRRAAPPRPAPSGRAAPWPRARRHGRDSARRRGGARG